MKIMTKMMTTPHLIMDIEIWFDDIVEDEDLEYPFLPCCDSIWIPN